MADLKCLRCNIKMEFTGRESFQLGEESYFSGWLAKMTAKSVTLDLYTCPNCGKVELFSPNRKKKPAPVLTNWTCSKCGTDNQSQAQTCQKCGVTRQWSEQNGKEK